MNLDETLMEQGGVLRCCIATVAREHGGQDVELGAVSECPHCHTKFKLVSAEEAKKAGTGYAKPTRPVWKPLWQLEKKHG